ncbi:hypothetical protein [Corallococcus terminator]|nr:hypothetical protein [Corallococcus terminator]
MANWKRLEKLNGGEKIYYVEPPLDTKREVWFFAADNRFRVWRDGQLHKGEAKRPQVEGPVTERFTLYKLLEQLFVDVEIRKDAAVVRRGMLNGADLSTRIDPSEVALLLAHYRELGFRDGFAWNATKTRVTRREYRKGVSTRWTVEVDGSTVIEDGRKEFPTASREAAIAHAEKRIRAREKAGFALHLIELWNAKNPNPEPRPPKGVSASKPLPKRPALVKPKDAWTAVDAAIDLLKDLHTRLPKAHFVTECLEPKADRARITSVENAASFFLRMHKARVGRWAKAKPRAPKKGESSWAYFRRVYGSITWILDGQADPGLSMFYCGNVTGGGWSCLEIDSDSDYPLDDLVELTGNEELADLVVFHGGWHHDLSFAFDPREVSPTGEQAIIPFGDNLTRLPRRVKPERIVPFGDWLYRRVVALTKVAERNLRELN